MLEHKIRAVDDKHSNASDCLQSITLVTCGSSHVSACGPHGLLVQDVLAKGDIGLYGEALADFKDPSNANQAVQCLNHMVTDALRFDVTTLLDESPICTLPHLYFTVCTLHQRHARHGVVG